MRLAKLIAFEACELKREEEGLEAFTQNPSPEGCESLSREVTTTRFRLIHPEIKAPFVFEATHHVFAGELLGTGKRLDGLTWKVDLELIGFFLVAFHTQTYQCGEELDRSLLDEVRSALNTPLSPSELAVLLMLAGNACRGAAAWNDVEDVCFWSNNFSLPEFRVR
mmetsp:Transcript_39696/g.94045  ORF Transcript_39696/g.94045 Transcript_39696/m.94045 type:complete len:166 (-) Transcript_39696:63-560(-)